MARERIRDLGNLIDERVKGGPVEKFLNCDHRTPMRSLTNFSRYNRFSLLEVP
jgi:hypothetical protein